jgi:hypothetical protein
MDDGLRWEGPTTARRSIGRPSSLKRGHSFRRGTALGPGNSEPRGLRESFSPAKRRRSGVLSVGKLAQAVDNYNCTTLKYLLRAGFIPNR